MVNKGASEKMKNYTIMKRDRILINTDPQRRCYYGVHKKSELIWGKWEELEFVKEEKLQQRMYFWKELNDFAVSQCGEEAKTEFKFIETIKEN
jgi:hypothetical protein